MSAGGFVGTWGTVEVCRFENAVRDKGKAAHICHRFMERLTESLKVLNGHKSDECVLDSLVVFCGKGDPKLVGGAVMCV